MKRSTLAKCSLALASDFFLMFLYYALCSGITTFEEMVTKKVISQAVACLAKDMQGPGWGSNPASYTARNGIIWMAGQCARYAVYAGEFGEDWYRELEASISIGEAGANQNIIGYWEKPENGGGSLKTYYRYLNIKELAREYLRNPEQLERLYHSYRYFILAEVTKFPGLSGKISTSLAGLKPLYTIVGLPIPKKVFQDEMEHLSSLKAQWKQDFNARGVVRSEAIDAISMEWRTLEENLACFGITLDMINTYEWFERRRAEGGQELVDVWWASVYDLELHLALASVGE